MAGKSKSNSNSRQKKHSFSLLGLFRGKKSSRSDYNNSSSSSRADEYVKAYKVYPSDYDRGKWVAEPGIDNRASEYISLTANKWEELANAAT